MSHSNDDNPFETDEQTSLNAVEPVLQEEEDGEQSFTVMDAVNSRTLSPAATARSPQPTAAGIVPKPWPMRDQVGPLRHVNRPSMQFTQNGTEIPETTKDVNGTNETISEENPFDTPSVPHLLSLEVAPTSTPSPEFMSSPREAEILPVCWRRELRELVVLAIPAVLVNLLAVAMGTASQMLIGHISSDALAAAVCANLVFNILFFFLFGFAGALDTLAAQSFGAGSMHGVNLWTKRAVIIVSLLCIPIAIPMFWSYGIMTSILGQPAAIANTAQAYLRWLVLGLWPFMMTLVMQKYLQSQSVLKPTIWISLVANIANVLLEALFIWPAGMGAQGGALGMALARWFQFVITGWYIYNRVHDMERAELDRVANEIANPQAENDATTVEMTNVANELTPTDPASSPSRLTLLRQSSTRAISNGARKIGRSVSQHALYVKNGASRSMRQLASGARAAGRYARNPRRLARDMSTLRKESLEGVWNHAAIKVFLKLGLASGLMSGLEVWAFEATGIMATSLTLLELDAHYVLLNTTLLTFFTFPFGVSIAASIRIGNLVGAGHVHTAQLTAKLVAAIGAGFMAVSGICIASTHQVIGYLFSSDPQVVAQVARIAPIGGLFQLFDGIQGATGGVLRGLGLQRAAALSNLCGLWATGVTSAYILTFPVGMGLPGLWWGLAIGLLVQASLNCTVLYRTDWHKQVADAQERIRTDEVEYAARRAEILEEATRNKPGAMAFETDPETSAAAIPEL